LKSSDHLPISDVVVKFTCAGQILVNVLDQDTSELQFGENQSSSDNQD
jgi:hypothetical protein